MSSLKENLKKKERNKKEKQNRPRRDSNPECPPRGPALIQ